MVFDAFLNVQNMIFTEILEMGFAGMNFKCNMDQLVGRLEQLLGMHRLFLRSESLLVLEMEVSRYS